MGVNHTMVSRRAQCVRSGCCGVQAICLEKLLMADVLGLWMGSDHVGVVVPSLFFMTRVWILKQKTSS